MFLLTYLLTYGLHVGSLFVGCIFYADDILCYFRRLFWASETLEYLWTVSIQLGYQNRWQKPAGSWLYLVGEIHTVVNCIWMVHR